ncbi:hypothetical protein OD917_07780 [Flavobacterium sp. SH_e]|uniref:hypothetical protein n=1 Tax=Flavobacterium TaxID=237 RepID=UPI0021E4B41D|nr:hypothetical protein [Flavobacterium sp. SH_e]MCV2484820.1 hypothetical protein [Flavobacterium sp. SH_e]
MKLGVMEAGAIKINFAIKAAQLGYGVLAFDAKEIGHLNEIAQKIGGSAQIADFILFSVKWENLESILSNLQNMAEKIILRTNSPIFNLAFPSPLPVTLVNPSLKEIGIFLPEAHAIKVFKRLRPSFK